jgi:hypothetical protein
MSTGGAAMNAMMNTEVAVKRVGIIKHPNQPMYKRLSVLVTHSQKRAQVPFTSDFSKIAVMINSPYINWNFSEHLLTHIHAIIRKTYKVIILCKFDILNTNATSFEKFKPLRKATAPSP